MNLLDWLFKRPRVDNPILVDREKITLLLDGWVRKNMLLIEAKFALTMWAESNRVPCAVCSLQPHDPECIVHRIEQELLKSLNAPVSIGRADD